MAMPTITVEVAFTTDPGATPTWTDLSSRLVRFSVDRGRQRELDRFSAGRAQIVLDNTDRALDPSYTSSAYYPNVVPMRRVRIRATYNAITYDIFNGYADSWDQTYEPPAVATCTLQATDAFKVLGNMELLTSVYAEDIQTAAPALWWRLGEPSGATQAVEAMTGNYPLTPIATPAFGTASLNAYDPDSAVRFDAVNDGLQGVFPEGTFPFTTAGTIEFLYRYDGAGSVSLAVATLGTTIVGLETVSFGAGNIRVRLYNTAGGSFTVDALGAGIDDSLPHHIAITWAAGVASAIYVDGVNRTTTAPVFTGTMANTTDKWLVALNAVDYPPFYGTGGTAIYDEVAIYTAALSAATIAAHAASLTAPWANDRTGARVGRILDVAGWPAADRNIDTGVSILQATTLGGSVLSALQQIEDTEQGALFAAGNGTVRFVGRDTLIGGTNHATFGDSGSELEYADIAYSYDDQLIWNEVQVTRERGVTQVVGDTTSQTRYLRRTKVFDGMLYSTDTEARGLAQWWITHYKDPILRATNMRLEPAASNETTHYPHVLGRELLDRVTVRRRPQNLGAAIDQETLIEGITHNVTAQEWVTTWNLSPAETQVYWLAGVAGRGEAGVNTRAGF
jgi:hypothetical protein